MSGFVLSPRAKDDIEAIWDYSAKQWGRVRTERYLRELWHGIEFVAADPRRGRSCDEIRMSYFKYEVGSHVIFYRIALEGIVVIRVLHVRMDFVRHL